MCKVWIESHPWAAARQQAAAAGLGSRMAADSWAGATSSSPPSGSSLHAVAPSPNRISLTPPGWCAST